MPVRVTPSQTFQSFDLNTLQMKSVMTPSPSTVDEDMDLASVRRIFREKKIRHLPVLHDGILTGILSERDTRVVGLMPDITKIAVADLMTRKPATVSEETSVLAAVSKMAANKYGCLVVTATSGQILGIFTSQDAMRVLLAEKQIALPVADGCFSIESSEQWPGDYDDCLE